MYMYTWCQISTNFSCTNMIIVQFICNSPINCYSLDSGMLPEIPDPLIRTKIFCLNYKRSVSLQQTFNVVGPISDGNDE